VVGQLQSFCVSTTRQNNLVTYNFVNYYSAVHFVVIVASIIIYNF